MPQLISSATILIKALMEELCSICLYLYKRYKQGNCTEVAIKIEYRTQPTTLTYYIQSNRKFMTLNWFLQEKFLNEMKSVDKINPDLVFDMTSVQYVSTFLSANKSKGVEKLQGEKFIQNMFTTFIVKETSKQKSSIGLKIADDIYIKCSKNFELVDQLEENKKRLIIGYHLVSKNKTVVEISQFIQEITDDFLKFYTPKDPNKIYHFIYQGNDDKKLNFKTYILSDSSANVVTFDHLFFEEKEKIIEAVNRLKNVEFYKKYGVKRKVGFLFEGKSGNGKTSTAIAIANETKRHIIEIPMSRIKMNKEIEKIVNISEINGIKFDKDQVIIVFDEMDQAKITLKDENEDEHDEHKEQDHDADEEEEEKENTIVIKKENKENDNKENKTFVPCDNHLNKTKTKNKNNNKNKDKDELNFKFLLSMIDDISNTEGLIMIGTTNRKEVFSPSLIRDGRLQCIHFDNMSIKSMKDMIRVYYNDPELNEEQNQILLKLDKQISAITFRNIVISPLFNYHLKRRIPKKCLTKLFVDLKKINTTTHI